MILIATCNTYPHPTPSLKALLDALEAEGVDASHVPWKSTPLETYGHADVVVPLCCWDYHDEPERFLVWLEAVEALGVKIANPPDLIRWNFRKTYLLHLAAQGLRVPPTLHLPIANQETVRQAMERENWTRAVLKPVSGQSGYGVRKINIGEAADWVFDELPGGEALLQEFQADIGELGETTLTFTDGVFSHATRRVLKAGEWRANLQFGTTLQPVPVDDSVIEEAKAYLAALPEHPFYARIDGLLRPDGFTLMELELIEPNLYLEFSSGGARRLAQALARVMS